MKFWDKAVTGSFLGRQSYFILMLNSSNWFIFPDTCNCHGTDILTIDHHPDFYDGALLEHPILKGDYTFNAPTGNADVADGLHPKGYFTKPGKFWSIYDFSNDKVLSNNNVSLRHDYPPTLELWNSLSICFPL